MVTKEALETAVNGAGLTLTSRDNNKNNLRIKGFFSAAYPDLAVSFANDKIRGYVTVQGVTTRAEAEAVAQKRMEQERQRYQEAAARKKFLCRVRTPSGIDALRLSLERHLAAAGYESASVEASRSCVATVSTYVRAVGRNMAPITIKVSDHFTVGQRLGHSTDCFVDLTEMSGTKEVWAAVKAALDDGGAKGG